MMGKSIKPFALTVGVPARQIGWMSQYGERLELPLVGNAETVCSKTGQKYVLDNDVVRAD